MKWNVFGLSVQSNAGIVSNKQTGDKRDVDSLNSHWFIASLIGGAGTQIAH